MSAPRLLARATWNGARAATQPIRRVLGRSDDRPAASASDLLDDLAFSRPWNVVIKAARLRARLRQRLGRVDHGVTVAIVNWNTRAVLVDTLRAVRALTPPTVPVLVVDNGSTDGSREWLGSQSDIQTIALRANAGHAVALDLAVLSARTSVVVTLDSDAVPLRPRWLDVVVEPVRSGRAVLCGLRASRDYVHPVFMAVDLKEFTRRRLSFETHFRPGASPHEGEWGVDRWDTGELLSRAVDARELVFIDPTPNAVDGLPGMTTGEVVYHHGGVSRASSGGSGRTVDESYRTWHAALRALLPPEAAPPPLD